MYLDLCCAQWNKKYIAGAKNEKLWTECKYIDTTAIIHKVTLNHQILRCNYSSIVERIDKTPKWNTHKKKTDYLMSNWYYWQFLHFCDEIALEKLPFFLLGRNLLVSISSISGLFLSIVLLVKWHTGNNNNSNRLQPNFVYRQWQKLHNYCDRRFGVRSMCVRKQKTCILCFEANSFWITTEKKLRIQWNKKIKQ